MRESWAVSLFAAITVAACSKESPPIGASDTGSRTDLGGEETHDAGPDRDLGAPLDTGDTPDLGTPDTGATDLGPIDGGIEPLDRTALCDVFVHTFCDAIDRCSCPEAITMRCEAATRALCTQQFLAPAVVAKIADGTINYDPYAARSFVDRLAQTSSTCGDPFSSLGWTVGDYYTIGGIFRGTLQEGELCSIEYIGLQPSECERGMCLEEDGDVQCLKLARPGESCEGPIFCADFSERLDPLLSIGDNLAIPCVATSSAGPHVCVARLTNGSTCVANYECASHRCGGTSCEDRLAIDSACTRDNDCASGCCDPTTGPPTTCEAGDLPVGSTCTRSRECASDFCSDDRCAPAICGGLRR